MDVTEIISRITLLDVTDVINRVLILAYLAQLPSTNEIFAVRVLFFHVYASPEARRDFYTRLIALKNEG